VELELAGVLPMPEGSAGIIVLREKGKETILPLVVPDGKRFVPGRTREPGLLRQAIEALGGRVSEVQIDAVEESSGGARVRLARGGERIELEAAPAESIALAVAAGVPILTTRRLLDEAGLTREDLARIHARVGRGATLRL
jgi:bifunctional DNase/RNase